MHHTHTCTQNECSKGWGRKPSQKTEITCRMSKICFFESCCCLLCGNDLLVQHLCFRTKIQVSLKHTRAKKVEQLYEARSLVCFIFLSNQVGGFQKGNNELSNHWWSLLLIFWAIAQSLNFQTSFCLGWLVGWLNWFNAQLSAKRYILAGTKIPEGWGRRRLYT